MAVLICDSSVGGHQAASWPEDQGGRGYYETDVYNSAVNSLDLEWIEKHKVTGISFHKEPNTLSKHEYIGLRCSFPLPSISVLNGPTSLVSLPSLPVEGSPQQSLPQSLKKGRYGALDQFQYALEDDFGRDQIQWFVPLNPVTILDVAVLARVLHADSPRYELLRRQCFWFAYMIYEIVLRVFKANDSSVEGLVPVSYKEHNAEKAMGRGKWIVPINDPSELLENLEALTDKFKVEIDKAKEKINRCINSCVKEKEQREGVVREEQVKREEAEELAREERLKREAADKEVQKLREELEALKAAQSRVQA
ncbi:hypothetical protein BKA70DRAFT_1222114 [Coprinopsis sp. MPI-PUGE-AT-0042]|nr:hypothetical protein BKA70DRAFT_1222114 [Coprinopsis sp. MPI-PUGE-AT-0042]